MELEPVRDATEADTKNTVKLTALLSNASSTIILYSYDILRILLI